MSVNIDLINHFYSSFQQKDFKGMQACYAENATFSDEVFVNLNAAELCAMWEMLCKNGKDLRIDFEILQAEGDTVQASWTAHYTFSRTGNKVVNRIKASFVITDGKILQHRDYFSFYQWAKQALGISGLLLGWTNFMRNKVRTTARASLNAFMLKQTAVL